MHGKILMTSSVSSYLALIDAMQWTPYMDVCLQVLSESKECIFDEIFIAQVRCQLLAQRFQQGALQAEDPEQSQLETPAPFYLRTLRTNLKQIRGSISPGLHDDGEFQALIEEFTAKQYLSASHCRYISCRVEYL